MGCNGIRIVTQPVWNLGLGGVFAVRKFGLAAGLVGDRDVGRHVFDRLVRGGVQLGLGRRIWFATSADRSLGLRRSDGGGDAAVWRETSALSAVVSNGASGV